MIQKLDLAGVHLNLISMLVDKERNENNIRQPLQAFSFTVTAVCPAHTAGITGCDGQVAF